MENKKEITIRICKNCAYWGSDKFNLHKACKRKEPEIPCGEMHSCSKHQYIPGFALKMWVKNHGG